MTVTPALLYAELAALDAILVAAAMPKTATNKANALAERESSYVRLCQVMQGVK